MRDGVLRLRRGLRPVLACALLAGALLAGLSAGAQAQTVECTAANADGSYNVPTDWALKPSSLAVGTKFRLLFISSTRRNADSFFIRDYNTFVQTRAKAGHSAISDSCGNRFKVVASTTFHARDNTMTRSTDTGASIHWLNGAKVADDYADFYDGNWDSYAGRQEDGSSRPMENIHVFTGSYANGTSKHLKHLGATYFEGVRRGDFRPVTTGSNGHDGEPRRCTGGPIDSGCVGEPNVPGHFYGLSPVFTVIDGREVSLGAAAYEVGEGDAVSVTLNVKWPQSTATTVGITCTHGTTSAADFTACPATVTIPADAGTHAFDIQTTKDTPVEGDETFVVTIASVPAGFRTGTPSAATVTVVEGPLLSIVAPADADEGDSGTTDRAFTVRLSKPVAQAFTYNICFSGTASRAATRGTIPAGDDYQVVANSNAISHECDSAPVAAGATSDTQIGIRVKGDSDREGDETVVATLSLGSKAIALGIELGTSTATHTIQNDDTPVLSIVAPADADADEGDSGTTDRTFTVRLSKPVAQAFTYNICFSGTASRAATRGTIPAGDDYQVVANSNAISHECDSAPVAAGATSDTQIGIRVRGDLDREGDETVVATLSLGSKAIALGIELGTSTATHTIQNDDTPVLSIVAPADADEGDSGTTDRTFTVRLSKPVAEAFTYNICFSGTASRAATRGTIPAGDDYQVVANSNAISHECDSAPVAAGATSDTQIGIRVRGDLDREGDETVVATLSLGSKAIALGVELGTSTATHTIRGDDGARTVVTITPDSSPVTEGEEARFTVRRTGSTAGAAALTVALAAQRSGAFFDTRHDPDANAPKVTIPAGHGSVGFAVPTVADGTDEADGWVKVWVQDSFSAYLGDYEPARHGGYDAYARRYQKTVHYPYEIAGRSAAQVTVLDDEDSAPLSAELISSFIPADGLPEGATGRFNLFLSRTLETWETVTLPLTLGGTAMRGADYTLSCRSTAGLSCRNLESGAPSLTIDGAHFRSRTVGVPLLLTATEDNMDEPAEPVTLSLGGGTTSINIVDAPDAVTIAFTRSKFEVRENNSPAQPCMRVTPPSGRDIPLRFNLGGTATEGRSGDYYFEAPPVLTAGRRVACFDILAVDDARDVPDKTVVLALDTARLPDGVTLVGVTDPTLIIEDNEPTVVSLARTGRATVTEGATVGLTVTLARALVAGEVLDVPLAVSGTGVTTADWRLTLEAGADLDTGVTLSREDTATPRLRFEGAGARTATLVLETVDDGQGEGGAETFAVALGPNGRTDPNGFDHRDLGTNVNGGADPHPTHNRFTVAVNDDDSPPPTVSFGGADYSAAEGDAASVTVRISPTRSAPTAVGLAYADVTAAAGDDYTAAPASVTIPANAASHTFTIATTEDTDDEHDETFTVALGTLPDGVAAGSPSTATVTIADDDPTEVVLSTPDAMATEGDATDTAAIALALGRGLVAGERLSVPLSFSGGTAGTDFTLALSGSPRGVALNGATVVFTGAATPSAASATVLVTAGSDDDVNDDTVTVSLGPLYVTELSDGVTTRRDGDGRIVLADADAPRSASLTPFPAIAPTGMPEGASTGLNLDIGRALEAHETATLTLTLGGTATRGADYTLRCGNVAGVSCRNLTSGAPSLTIDGAHVRSRYVDQLLSLTAIEDNKDEPAESVTLRPGGGRTLRFNIVDAPDAVTIEFTRRTFDVRENNGPAEPCMRVTPPSGRDIPLYFNLGGTATEGRTGDWDFHFRDDPPVLRAGQQVACFSINLHIDARAEPDETVILALDQARLPSWVTLEGVADPPLIILGVDPTVVSLARTGRATVTEGATVGLTVTLTRSLVAGEVVDVPLAVSGTGVTTADWRLARAAGTDLNAGVTLTREDTATPRLRFAGAGARVATLVLEAVDDGLGEGGTETFTVALGPDSRTDPNGFEHRDLGTNVPEGAEPHPTRNRFTVTVRDGASRAPNIRIAPGPAVTEGTAATFTVTADPVAPASDLAVTLEVADAPGSDFVAASEEGAQTVTIRAGETSTTLTVPTQPDTTDEASGPVTATVTAAGQGYATGATGAVAVADNDPTTVTLSGTSSAIAEAGGTKVLTLTLSRALVAGERLDVPVDMGGVAQHGADYQLGVGRGGGVWPHDLGDPGGFLRFLGGQHAVRTATLTVTAVDDADDEGAGETVTVGLGTPVVNLDGVATASGSVSFEITDDDDPPLVITIAGGAAVIEGTPAVFTLTADRAPSADLAVKVEVADAPGSDFLAAGDEGAKTVVIGSGLTSATLTVPTQADTVDEPDGPVRATLAAGAGYRRGTPSSATVEVADDDVTVLPTLSIDDPPPQAEGEGQRTGFVPGFTLMRFTIRLSAPQPHTVRVTATARDSVPVSARGGQDYIPARLLGEFWPGQTTTHIWVTIIDDSHDENDETFEVVLSDARGAAIADAVAVATITNDDPMPAAWLARFGRTVAEQALDGIAGRLAAPRTPGMAGTLAGQALGGGTPSGDDIGSGFAPGGDGTGVAGRLHAHPDRLGTGDFGHDTGGFGNGFNETEPQSQTLTMRDALLGSRFTLTGAADASGGSLAFWGRASHGSFDGREGTFSLDGEATTALLGADYARDRWLVGLALAQSEGEGDYRDTKTAPRPDTQTCPDGAQDVLCGGAVREGDGMVEASLTAALPYASLEASQRLKLWGALGYGAGEVTLATAMGGRYRADTTWRMAAAGLRGDLLEAPAQGSGPALALTSDALWARTASEKTRDLAASASDVTRLRLGLEGSYRMALEGSGHLTPRLEVGARHDGGDAETGSGIELGGGIAWNDPALGLSLDVSGRTLIAHEDGALEDRGFAAALGFDPRPQSERGPSFSLRQDFGGQASGGLDALFQPAPLDERSGSEATSRWTAEAAWGLPAFGGRYTGSPHAGLGLTTGTRDYTLGWRWTPAEGAHPLSFGVKATRRESDGAAPEHAVGFEASARW